MTETTCKCGRPTRDGFSFCDQCGHDLSVALGEVPWIETEIEVTITRQKGVDYRTKGGTAASERPSPVVWGASEARTHLKALLVSWALFAQSESVRNQAPCTCDNGARPQGAPTPHGLSPAQLRDNRRRG